MKDEKQDTQKEKKPYKSPSVKKLGSVASLTLGGNPSGMNDPSGPSTGKF